MINFTPRIVLIAMAVGSVVVVGPTWYASVRADGVRRAVRQRNEETDDAFELPLNPPKFGFEPPLESRHDLRPRRLPVRDVRAARHARRRHASGDELLGEGDAPDDELLDDELLNDDDLLDDVPSEDALLEPPLEDELVELPAPGGDDPLLLDGEPAGDADPVKGDELLEGETLPDDDVTDADELPPIESPRESEMDPESPSDQQPNAGDDLLSDSYDLPSDTPSPNDNDVRRRDEDSLLDDDDRLLGDDDSLLDDDALLNDDDSLLPGAGEPLPPPTRDSDRAAPDARRPSLLDEDVERRSDDDSDTEDDSSDDTDDDTDSSQDDDNPYCLPKPEFAEIEFDPEAFIPDPTYEDFPYLPEVEKSIYNGKFLNPVERPWIELGRGMYLPGRLPRSQTFLGKHNLVSQHFLVYGDFRTATAYVQPGAGRDFWTWAYRLNLDFDWMITDTERIHGFTGPLDEGAQFTRWQLDNGSFDFIDAFDHNWDTIYFEGDLGSIAGGLLGYDTKFDMPFAGGLMPLLFMNGIWMQDAFVGGAFTFPAKHNSALRWSNYDLTFFFGFDELDTPAFAGDDSAADVMGAIAFIDAYGGYIEAGYAYVDDKTGRGLSYNNIALSFTRRYLQRFSNAVRVIVNAGQEPLNGPRTADGVLVLIENALVSSKPNTVVPYLNLFAGFGRPQSVARAGAAGGILINTGIVFETDGLTGFPFLDDTGSNTYGGAMGINWLGDNFDYQIIAEVGTVQTFGRGGGRRAVDDQYGAALRYQLPLTNAWLLRMDAIFGLFRGAEDISGGRVEMRYKF